MTAQVSTDLSTELDQPSVLVGDGPSAKDYLASWLRSKKVQSNGDILDERSYVDSSKAEAGRFKTFDGSTRYATFPITAVGLSNFSFLCTLRIQTAGTGSRFIMGTDGGGSGTSFELYLNSSDRLVSRIDGETVIGDTELDIDVEYKVALVVDRNTIAKVYVDAVQDGSADLTSTSPQSLNKTTMYIAKRAIGSNIECEIRDVRFCDEALSNTEVEAYSDDPYYGLKDIDFEVHWWGEEESHVLINSGSGSDGTYFNYAAASDGTGSNFSDSVLNHVGYGYRDAFLFGDNNGNDQAWTDPGFKNYLIPYDSTKIYQIKFNDLERVAGSGRAYLGWFGVDEDKESWVSTSGGDSISSQHYHAASDETPALGVKTSFIGYTSGTNAPGDVGGETSTPSSPYRMHQDVKYIIPLVLVNYSGQTGQTKLGSIEVNIVDSDGELIEHVYTIEPGSDTNFTNHSGSANSDRINAKIPPRTDMTMTAYDEELTVSSPPSVVPKLVDNACYKFDGATYYGGNFDTITLSGDFTILCYMKPVAAVGGSVPIPLASSSDNTDAIGWDLDSSPQVRMKVNGIWDSFAIDGTYTLDDKFDWYVVTRTGSTVKAYVNHELVGSDTCQTDDFLIDDLFLYLSFEVDAEISCLAIYESALTEDQQRSFSNFEFPANPKHIWYLGENTGNQMIDVVGSTDVRILNHNDSARVKRDDALPVNTIRGCSKANNLDPGSSIDNQWTTGAGGTEPPVAGFETYEGKESKTATWSTSITASGYAGSRVHQGSGGVDGQIVDGNEYIWRAKVRANRNLESGETVTVYYTGANSLNTKVLQSTDDLTSDWLEIEVNSITVGLSGSCKPTVFKSSSGAFSSEFKLYIADWQFIEADSFKDVDYYPTDGRALDNVLVPAGLTPGLDAKGNELNRPAVPGLNHEGPRIDFTDVKEIPGYDWLPDYHAFGDGVLIEAHGNFQETEEVSFAITAIGTSDLAFSFDIKKPDTSNSQFILSANGGGGSNAWDCFISSSGTFTSRIGGVVVTSGSGNETDEWINVIGNFDRDGDGSFYVDNALSGTADDISSVSGNSFNQTTLLVGGRSPLSSTNFLVGKLKNVKVYDKFLTSDERDYIATAGSSGTAVPNSNVMFDAPFNQTHGTSVINLKGSNGTLTEGDGKNFWKPNDELRVRVQTYTRESGFEVTR